MRKPPKKRVRSNDEPRPDAPAPPAESTVRTARAATEDELAAIARAQQGQHSAESFWKAAGRLTKLR